MKLQKRWKSKTEKQKGIESSTRRGVCVCEGLSPCVLQVFRVRSLGWMEVCEADMASGSIVISDCIRLLQHTNTHPSTRTLCRREKERTGEMEEVKMMNRSLDETFNHGATSQAVASFVYLF